ncbi:hypothetical protein [Aliikangiella sp. G2MR2-5]|uniref:hypothetical protein n=1 Tax=Aliikangiella sp. G2MR2-5 TaxID=2788943 RepID=UPI0018AB23B0|nr:hypothetical protein [Aliikangiella sp. G2MR2-5]
MSHRKAIKLLGISTFALGSLSASIGTALASDFSDLGALPVITDDCGTSSCADRRALTLEAFKAKLADASSKSSSSSVAKANNSSGEKSKKGQGLGLGQGNNDTQIVYLNFEQSEATFPAIVSGSTPWYFNSHQYTQSEKDEIQARIAADYEGFNISFTQEKPASGDFSTLNFECQTNSRVCVNFSGGILFGLAQGIDIQNTNRNDSAFVDAGLWEVMAQLDPSGNLLSRYSGIAIENGDVQAALSKAVVNQAANTGAHELGHNLGLRHHDSFGSPGSGLPSTGVPSADRFFPVFDGLQEGDEAILHTMASGASVGSGLSDSTARDRFLSERSVIKLAAAERGRLVNESSVSGGNKKVHLRKVVAPNTLLEGDNADGKLDIREALIRGQISVANEVDTYRFTAKSGEFISAEFNGYDIAIGDPVIGAIQMFYIEDDGTMTLVAQNFQNFEGLDAFLIDAPVEKSGDYVLAVSAPNFVSFGYQPDGTPMLFPLEENGYGALRVGDYNLSIYKVAGKSGNGVGFVPGAGQ